MPYGYSPLKTERFGGLNTLLDPTNLPSFASPDCQNIEFLPGLVRSRSGLVSQFAPIAGNPTINYLKTYVTQQNVARALALDGLGGLWKENPFGTLALIGAIEQPGAFGNSVSLFGREYLAFGDGQFGSAMPRQFDDVNFDRVSQIGPGVSPGVSDENVAQTMAASPSGAISFTTAVANSPNGLTQNGFVVTVKTNPAITGFFPYLRVGDPIQISGAGIGGYNGTWTISSISTDQLSIQFIANTSGLAASGGGTLNMPCAIYTWLNPSTVSYVDGQLVNVTGTTGFNTTGQIVRSSTVPNTAGYGGYAVGASVLNVFIGSAAFGLAASGSGTVTNAGNVVAGKHQISVMFGTRSGYITAPSAPLTFTAGGGKRLVVSPLPIGPANVTQRILIFTAAGGKSFFYSTGDPTVATSNMIVNDNTTTAATIDFSDTILLEGVNADEFFNLEELGECSGVVSYSSRLFWWGERNKINSNGGNGFTNLTFDGGFAGNGFPSGWTPDTTNSGGGGVGPLSVFGFSYGIVGSAATLRGMIAQSASKDSFSNPILQPNVAYSVRVRLIRLGAVLQGNFVVEIFSASAGSLGIFSQAVASVPTTNFQEYAGSLMAAQVAIPSDAVLRIYTNNTMTATLEVVCDSIEIYPTLQPFNSSLIRASKVEDPETYDGVTGILQPNPISGQNIRCCYVLRNLLRIATDSRIFVTADDGTNEPDQWQIQEVSASVGTLSARGVGLGDEWAIIAGRSGVWLDDGGSFTEDKKLSREIQPTWDSINWNLGYLVDVKVDTRRKRVYIAVPLGTSATQNNTVLMLDYVEGFGDPTPTNTVSIAGLGRKWSKWTIGCNSMNLILRSDNTYQTWFGNNSANGPATGKIYQLDPTRTVFTDDGAFFDAHWQSGYFQMPEIARMNWGYLIANLQGGGTCGLQFRKGNQGWLGNIRAWTLNANNFRNMERQINVETERLAVRFGTVNVGDNFSLQGFTLWAKESVFAPLRGVNS